MASSGSGGGLGRGKLLQVLKEKREKEREQSAAQSQTTPTVTDEPEVATATITTSSIVVPKPIGRGRINIQSFQLQGKPSQTPGALNVQSVDTVPTLVSRGRVGPSTLSGPTGGASMPDAVMTLVSDETTRVQTIMTTESPKSIEKAMDELRVERIGRTSPVRKMGESGDRALFMSNYIKLTCKNKHLYQYVVHYEPEVDSKEHRKKLLHMLNNITGPTKLFDGLVLFLPIFLVIFVKFCIILL